MQEITCIMRIFLMTQMQAIIMKVIIILEKKSFESIYLTLKTPYNHVLCLFACFITCFQI